MIRVGIHIQTIEYQIQKMTRFKRIKNREERNYTPRKKIPTILVVTVVKYQ